MQTHIKKNQNICRPWIKTQNLMNVGPFNKAVGLEKDPKVINVGPTFISESRVGNQRRL